MKRLLWIIPLAFLVSCSSSTTSGITVILTGQWVGQMLAGTNIPAPFSGTFTLNVTQEEDGTISGTITVQDPETRCWGGGTFTGTVTGSRFTFTYTDTFGPTVTVEGNATTGEITAFYTSVGNGQPVPDPNDPTMTVVLCTSHTGTFNGTRIL